METKEGYVELMLKFNHGLLTCTYETLLTLLVSLATFQNLVKLLIVIPQGEKQKSDFGGHEYEAVVDAEEDGDDGGGGYGYGDVIKKNSFLTMKIEEEPVMEAILMTQMATPRRKLLMEKGLKKPGKKIIQKTKKKKINRTRTMMMMTMMKATMMTKKRKS